MPRHPDPRPRVLLFLSLFFWCASLLCIRQLHSDTRSFAFLTWNLFLAWVPLGTAAMLVRAERLAQPAWLRWVWALLWLCFLPNAPYLVTDFMHLRSRPPVPLWFDVAMLLSYAGTGLLLGWTSVAHVHGVAERAWGRAAGWCVVVGSLLLSGFGVYVGRFLRWNSWDALLHPVAATRMVLGQLAAIDEQPRTLAVTLVYGIGLLLGYAALRTLARTFTEPRAPIADGA